MNGSAIDMITKNWVHSFEEDTANDLVYRPDEYELPKARGRDGISLMQNGVLERTHIGSNDVPDNTPGTWWFEDNYLVLKYDGQRNTFFVKELTVDKLVLNELV